MLTIDVITIFPDFFESTLQQGVVARALNNCIACFRAIDLRSFTMDRHRTVDDRPFGGGEGMVLKPEPITAAVESLGVTSKAQRDTSQESVILLSAQGKPFTQSTAHELASLKRIVMICGRYEGIDERVNDLLCDRELSIGDYVLSGGELAAAAITDAVIRLLPGVLGNIGSSHYESFGHAHDIERDASEGPLAMSPAAGLLDYPHYTRPADFRGTRIPEVLAAGGHTAIRRWRRKESLRKTLKNRPELLANATLSPDDKLLLREMKQETTPNILLVEGTSNSMVRSLISGITPFFIVRNIESSIAYYRDQLAFDVTYQAPQRDPFFAIVCRDGAMLMLKQVGVDPAPNSTRDAEARWDAYINVPDPDALASEFASRGVLFSVRLCDTHDGLRGFELGDADGYVLFFGRPR